MTVSMSFMSDSYFFVHTNKIRKHNFTRIARIEHVKCKLCPSSTRRLRFFFSFYFFVFLWVNQIQKLTHNFPFNRPWKTNIYMKQMCQKLHNYWQEFLGNSLKKFEISTLFTLNFVHTSNMDTYVCMTFACRSKYNKSVPMQNFDIQE